MHLLNGTAGYGIVAVSTAVLLAGCTVSRPAVFRAPPPPAVVSACSAEDVKQSDWVLSNIGRVQLGAGKSDVIAILGTPVQAETFLLSDGSGGEVLFYRAGNPCSPATAASSSSSGGPRLLPFVFQNGRLNGYGEHYYHDVVVPGFSTLGVVSGGAGASLGRPQLGRGAPLR